MASLILLLVGSLTAGVDGADARPEKPRFRQFMGLCSHTIQFKPDLYRPVCRAVPTIILKTLGDYRFGRVVLEKPGLVQNWPFSGNRVGFFG